MSADRPGAIVGRQAVSTLSGTFALAQITARQRTTSSAWFAVLDPCPPPSESCASEEYLEHIEVKCVGMGAPKVRYNKELERFMRWRLV